MKKTVVRFGVYGAITICCLFLLGWYLGTSLDTTGQEVIGYASMFIALSFVYFGIKHFRDKENDGVVSFKKALTIGLLITLLTSIAFGAIDVFYSKVLNPDFTANYYDKAIEDMRQSLPAAEFEVKLAELEAEKELFSNPILSFLLMAVTVFVIGFIIAIISALTLQRKN